MTTASRPDMPADPLISLIEANRAGRPQGIYSVCSAHPMVIEAAIGQAVRDQSPLLIEATCNQVNQYGGYTGLKPADFVAWISQRCQAHGLAPERLILGGDHLGPNPWKDQPAQQAMAKAEALVAAYAEAGFRKLHLDASMACADDPSPLPPTLIAQRSARLCQIAENSRPADQPAPVYIIGTEVPIPGGEVDGHDISTLDVTDPERARHTLNVHAQAFATLGLDNAFERVVAMVVQPGVEFGNHQVTTYQPALASALKDSLPDDHRLVYEAHSTDYQTEQALGALVADHFAILKVGPELTFALREALFALARIEAECVPADQQAQLPRRVEAAMQAEPNHWQPYVSSAPHQAALDRIFSFSDRIRYYWQQPDVAAAVQSMLDNLRAHRPSATIVHAYLPSAVAADFSLVSDDPEQWVIAHISEVLGRYARACGLSP